MEPSRTAKAHHRQHRSTYIVMNAVVTGVLLGAGLAATMAPRRAEAKPAPHIDAVESVIDYQVPVEKFTALAEFDGSVVVERTAGEVSARCHDEQANFLALNLMNDIVKETRERELLKSAFLFVTQFLADNR